MRLIAVTGLLLLIFAAACVSLEGDRTSYSVPAGQDEEFQRDLADCRARAEAAIAPIPARERDYSVYDNYNEIVEQCLRSRGYEPVR